MVTDPAPLDLPTLIESWTVHLRALNRSDGTYKLYTASADRFVQWCTDNGHPAALDRRLVARWIAELLDGGAAANTASVRLAGVRQLAEWAAAEGEIPADPLLGLNAPKAPIPVTPVLGDDELKALIRALHGRPFE